MLAIRRDKRLWITALLVAVGSCGADKAASPAPVVPTPAALSVVSGNDQSGMVNSSLTKSLVVRATTAAKAPLAGVAVRFAVTSGAATVTPSSGTTDANGEASTAVALAATAGLVEVSATITGTSLATTFRATALIPEPDSTAAPNVYNPDWTEPTHGKVAPVYDIVFPQTGVNTIEITLSAAQWASIRANMVQLYGFDFGGRPAAGGGFPDDDPDYVALTVKYNGKAWKKAGFRLKGNSTLSSAWGSGNYKLPFRLKLNEWEDTYPAIKNQRFYGFKELSFSPGRSDPSLIREKSAADIFRLAGVPAARTAFYRVFIDFGAGLQYCGVYTAVEVIDDTMLKDQYGEDKGNIYKPESALRQFATPEFEKKNNKTSDYNDVRALVSTLNSTLRTSDAAQWRTNLESVFNVDMFLRWMAVNTGMVNWDAYGVMAHNYYLYNHSTKHLTWVPWDHNESLTGSPGVTGTAGGPAPGSGVNRALSLSMNEVSASWPALRYLMDDPVYSARYKSLLKTFKDSILIQANMDAMFDRYTALISPYVIGPNGEQAGYTYTNAAAFAAALPALKAHIQNRRALITSYVP